MFSAATKSAHSAATAANYIEDVFSTYLYTGTGSSQTITNGIDLAGEGGMVWFKSRTTGGSSYNNHSIVDSARGASATGYYSIYPNLTDGNFTPGTLSNAIASAFNSNGFTIQSNPNNSYNTQTEVSWTFRKQAKFFDVVTYTGNGDTNGQNISHSLGSEPGCIIIKATSTTGNWLVYHRSTPWAGGAGPGAIYLNTTAASSATNAAIGYATSTMFNVGDSSAITAANTNGVTYVAYLFAHDAGGFGASGTDNVISCGSFTTDSNGNNSGVNLGYEPQWILIKDSTNVDDWYIYDSMRGMTVNEGNRVLYADLSAAEGSYTTVKPSATGFYINNNGLAGNATYIYIAIRRGPMATPTTGTSVFSPVLGANTSTGALIYNTGFPVDMLMQGYQAGGANNAVTVDRLRGSPFLSTSLTDAEATPTYVRGFASNSGVVAVSGFDYTNIVGWNFRRAPGFFDEVCYTGTGSATTQAHNLGVAPELMIVKSRDLVENWAVYAAPVGATKAAVLNRTYVFSNSGMWNSTSPTSSVFSIGTNTEVNQSGSYYVAYLFATLAGVSKVGSYTGTGTTNQINCGFTGGARFVMIKRTDDTGAWYVWDSARGIVAGNDPYLLLNSTAAEVTNTDYVDTYSAGFEISSTAPAEINANGGSYIYLAIA